MSRPATLLALTAFVVAAPVLAQVPAQERNALLVFHEATAGPQWHRDDGWLGPPGTECTWLGVHCDQGHVIGLELPSNNLQGDLPDALTGLPFLQWLELGENLISGPVPAWLGQLPTITGVVLNQNRLAGFIPVELANAATLVYLNLRDNQLEGPIPSQLGDLPALGGLELHGNRLTGTIPPELGRASTLWTLALGDNQLDGPIPTELGNLASLEHLDLSLNHLTGTIPDSLQNLTELVGLWLSGNELEGPLPSWLGDLANLQHLALDLNRFSGSIPPQLGSLNQLVILELSANQLEGAIPPELGNLTRLQALWIGANLLSGSIPPELGDLTEMRDLWLSVNQLEGPVPAELGNLSQLVFLGLDNNLLSGPLPPELGNLTAVEELLLSNNEFSGALPPELGTLTELRVLHLANCHLQGPIPTEIGGMTSLKLLNLTANALVGEIPSSFSRLEALDEGGLSLWLNGLYTTSSALGDFVDSRHAEGGLWRYAQTVAPTWVNAVEVGPTEVVLEWTPIPYSWDPGAYQVGGSTTPGGPYELLVETTSKEATSVVVTGLEPDTTYYLVVRTVTPPNESNRNRVESDPGDEITITTASAGACRVTCSTTVPATGVVNEPVSFQGDAQTSGCAASPSFAWSFGDGATSTERSPRHVYTSEGTYSWRLVVSADAVSCTESGVVTVFGAGADCGNGTCETGETTWTCPADCPLGTEATGRVGFSSNLLALPAAVGGQAGVGGTYWVTEAMLHNPGDSPATVTFHFVADAQAGVVTSSEPLQLPAGGAAFSADFVQELFGSTANGSVRVQADQPVMLVSRTFNDQPTGTYGQFLGAVPFSRILKPGDVAFLVGLQEDDDFRTNVILQEVSGTQTDVDLRVFDATGASLGATRVTVPGGTKWQARLANLGYGDVQGYAAVQVVSGGGVVAIASVVDQETGDAMTVDALHRDQATLGPARVKTGPLASGTAAKQQAVDFTWSPESPRVDETVHFTDLSSGNVRSWSWRFGDGGSSTLQNPTHTYAAAGTYAVTLVVSSSSFGSVFRTQTLTVSEETTAGLRYLLPVVARQPGAAGTTWRSDVWLLNPMPTAQRVVAEYLPVDGGAVHRTSATVRSGEQRHVVDVVESLFPQAGDGKGALHLVAPDGVFVTSRTYNLGATGTFGQAIPALAAGDLLAVGDTGRLLKLKSTAATRCNVGFTELDGSDTTVSLHLLEVVDGATSLAAHATYDLEPHQNLQVNRVFETLGLTSDYEGALALVTVTAGGRVYAYASNVDSQTGDAEFIPAMSR